MLADQKYNNLAQRIFNTSKLLEEQLDHVCCLKEDLADLIDQAEDLGMQVHQQDANGLVKNVTILVAFKNEGVQHGTTKTNEPGAGSPDASHHP